jgi:hypothetical protein
MERFEAVFECGTFFLVVFGASLRLILDGADLGESLSD